MPLKETILAKLQTLSDKTAISLSVLCAIHCLALPLLLVALPSLATLKLDTEMFHFAMVFAVIPISIYALTMGCRQHNRKSLLLLGAIGIVFLCAALFLPHEVKGESGEKILTLMGALLIAIGHMANYRLCKKQALCGCSSTSTPAI